jgi:endonuclease YncB( thermonuclease family)
MGCGSSTMQVKNQTCVEPFSLNGVEAVCRPIRVIDGDTLIVAFKFRGVENSFRIRLAGIDTPELKSPNEAGAARAAKVQLQNFLTGDDGRYKPCIVRIRCNDKYGGRFVGDIECCGEDAGRFMLRTGFAQAYDGRGPKRPWPIETLQAMQSALK